MNPPASIPDQQDASPNLNSGNKAKSKGNKKKTRKNSGHESQSQSNFVDGSELGDIREDDIPSGMQ